jgi:hypothetical protein
LIKSKSNFYLKVDKERPSPAKLSYAQMVQKGRENEENTADGKADDLSDNSGNESPQCSRMTLKEQSQRVFPYQPLNKN